MGTTNKVAIVTASDSGIGKQCALVLAKQGYDIGITWHSDDEGAKEVAEAVASFGRRAETVQLDLSNLPEGAQAIQTLIDRFGRIDVLVNNAGAMSKAPFLEMAFEEWRTVFTVDVDGAFLCAQIAARKMVEQGEGGRIINITSVHEHTPLPGGQRLHRGQARSRRADQVDGDGAGAAQNPGKLGSAGGHRHPDERHEG